MRLFNSVPTRVQAVVCKWVRGMPHVPISHGVERVTRAIFSMCSALRVCSSIQTCCRVLLVATGMECGRGGRCSTAARALAACLLRPPAYLAAMASSSSSDADLVSLMRDLESRQQGAVQGLRDRFEHEVQACMRQFQGEHRSLLQRIEASAGPARLPREETEVQSAALPDIHPGSGVPETTIRAAMVFVDQTVRRAVEGLLPEDLHLAVAGTPETLARLYDKVNLRMVQRKREGGTRTQQFKHCLRVVRDLLLLKVCIGGRAWTRASLEATFDEIFGRVLDDTIISQLNMCFLTLLRCGRDRGEFVRKMASSYSEGSDPQMQENLFQTFVHCAWASPFYQSARELERPGRPPRPRRSRQEEATADDVLDSELEQLAHSVGISALEEPSSSSTLAANPGSPVWVDMPEPVPKTRGAASVTLRSEDNSLSTVD